MPPAVRQSVSTALSGNVQEAVERLDGDESVMINTIAASVPAVSPSHTATCKLIISYVHLLVNMDIIINM